MNGGMHHLHVRKRIYKNLEAFPAKNAGKRFFDYAIYVMSIAGPVVLLPQVLAVYSTHSVAGLSLITWAMLGCMNIMWCFYAIIHRERPIFISNLLTGTFNFIVVAGILLYR